MTTATLPSSWAQSTACLTSGDYWGWSAVDGYADVLGEPTDSTACYPPGFNPTGYMYGNDCPDGFTSACGAISGFTSEAITCCPTGTATELYLSPFASLPCRSNFASVTNLTITITNLASHEATPTTVSRDTNAVLHAMGIELRPVQHSSSSLMTTSSTIMAPSTTSTKHHSSSLSAGASAGIGVGVGIAVLFLAGFVWLMYRRRLRRSNSEPSSHTSHTPSGTQRAISELLANKPQEQHELSAQQAPQSHELPSNPLNSISK
ncbi:hypothetical protein N7451_007499 [Penicillium sp. IBT 35674x]|nr:hypothetical protein N7451_007499 [Penicillium sp. IBT 35674x]